MKNGAPVVKDAERCTGCRWCELHCPDFAICVKEVAKPEKRKPRKRTEMKGFTAETHE